MKSTILTLLSTFNFLRFIKHNAVLLQQLHEPLSVGQGTVMTNRILFLKKLNTLDHQFEFETVV